MTELVYLKVADMLEAYITASQQNNRYARVVADRAWDYAIGHAEDLPKDVVDKILKIGYIFGVYRHD